MATITRADESERDLLEKIVGSLNSALFSFAEVGARQRPPPRRDLTIVRVNFLLQLHLKYF